jgi:hypothetical protein
MVATGAVCEPGGSGASRRLDLDAAPRGIKRVRRRDALQQMKQMNSRTRCAPRLRGMATASSARTTKLTAKAIPAQDSFSGATFVVAPPALAAGATRSPSRLVGQRGDDALTLNLTAARRRRAACARAHECPTSSRGSCEPGLGSCCRASGRRPFGAVSNAYIWNRQVFPSRPAVGECMSRHAKFTDRLHKRPPVFTSRL